MQEGLFELLRELRASRQRPLVVLAGNLLSHGDIATHDGAELFLVRCCAIAVAKNLIELVQQNGEQ